MSNVLNSIIANQPINSPIKARKPVYTIDTEGKIKPLEDRGRLLPSRIFGSPIEYVKDLKKDVVSIGRAATGKANDHELGRINDLAMKLGSIGLASYLFVKNPLKLNKAMEFIGAGTFFGAMALWPKLAIQAPLKARTGVDIHQKYIDSQGRKKMLFQDPQYVLTDLYSREDLDKLGKKLGVNENLPDRDNFIKKRAQKTALQGNTLWMLTAGFATPTMSALMCNVAEKPLQRFVLTPAELKKTEADLAKIGGEATASAAKKIKASVTALENVINQNSDELMNEGMIKKLANKISRNVHSASFRDVVAEELTQMKMPVVIDESFVRNALNGKIADDLIDSLADSQRTLLNEAIENGSFSGIAKVLGSTFTGKKHEKMQFISDIQKTLMTAKKRAEIPTVSQVADKIRELSSLTNNFVKDKIILDDYVSARVGDKGGTYIAEQWGRVGRRLMTSFKNAKLAVNPDEKNLMTMLNLTSKELRALSDGNMKIITDKLTRIAGDEKAYARTIRTLMDLINDYNDITGSDFTSVVAEKADGIYSSASRKMMESGFDKVSQKLAAEAKAGTIGNFVNANTRTRALGAKSSLYRLVQTLDVFKRIENNTLKTQLATALSEVGKTSNDAEITKLVKACKNLMLKATTTDYVEKLKSAGFNLTQKEYDAVMEVLFGQHSENTIKAALNTAMEMEQQQRIKAPSFIRKALSDERITGMLDGLQAYKNEFMQKVACWENGMVPELARCTVKGVKTKSPDAIERNALVGKPIRNMIQDYAKQAYNSNKWLKIFGGTMLGLTVVTLTAGLFIGRKSEVEKKVEAEGKVNG